MTNREITSHDRANAARLKAIWDDRKSRLKLTQASAASALGFNSQSSVSQYLHCRIALNLEAIVGFAQLLHCEPSDIDPELGGLQAAPTSPGYEVPVVGVLPEGAGEPTQKFITVRYSYMPEHCYAVEIRGDIYGTFAPAGTHLTASKAEMPIVGDDIVLTLATGAQTLGVLKGMDPNGLDVLEATTNTRIFYKNEDIECADPIVERSRKLRRPTRINAIKKFG